MNELRLHDALHDPALTSMTFLNEICIRYPDAISFAPGRPLEDAFDTTLLTRYTERYVQYLCEELQLDNAQAARLLLQYGNTSGIIQPLIAEHLRLDEGIVAAEEDIVVTVGAQEAMFITLRAMCAGPEDALLVPEPAYVGIVGAAKLLGVPIVPVAEEPGGLTVQAVETAYHQARARGLKPVLCYLVPSYSNPAGVSLTAAQRREVLAFAARFGLFVMEDNPYGLFARRPNAPEPTMKSLDADGRVIYIGSFAKSGFPGARVGYVVAGQKTEGGRSLADALAAVKSMITVNTPPVAQAMIGGMLLECGCNLKARNEHNVQRYSDNLDALQSALEGAFPSHRAAEHGVTWNTPDGGFFTVVKVPFAADEATLDRCARDHGVLWSPMRHFYTGTGGEQAIRLSSSLLSPADISEGISRFARFVQQESHAARRANTSK